MRCSKVRKLLSDYIDETLNISVEEHVRQHLDHCPQCADLAADLSRNVKVLQGLAPLTTSPDFMQNLRRHLSIAEGLTHRQPARRGVLACFSGWMTRGYSRRFGLVLAPVALGLSMALYLWNARFTPMAGPLPREPVISESAYLAGVAQEHAGYAREHPLIDASAAELNVSVANAVADR